jgi:hypothetical protein
VRRAIEEEAVDGWATGQEFGRGRPALEAYAQVAARLYRTADREQLGDRVMVYLASLLEPIAYTFALALQKRGSGPDPNAIIRKSMERTPVSVPVQLGVLSVATLAEVVATALPQCPTVLAELRSSRGEGLVLALTNRRVELVQFRMHQPS